MKLNTTALANNGVTSTFETTKLCTVRLNYFGTLDGGTLTLQCCQTVGGSFVDYYGAGTLVSSTTPNGSKADGINLELAGGLFWLVKLTGAGGSVANVIVHADGDGIRLIPA